MTTALFLKLFPLWIKAFLLTQVIEIPLYVLVGRKGRISAAAPPTPIWRLALAGAACSCITHPLLWFVWILVVKDYVLYVVSGEILVALIEIAVFYLAARPIRFRYAVLATLIANGASCALGFWLQ